MVDRKGRSLNGVTQDAEQTLVLGMTNDDRSHALRGYGWLDAQRPCDAERHGMHTHAERGHDHKHMRFSSRNTFNL